MLPPNRLLLGETERGAGGSGLRQAETLSAGRGAHLPWSAEGSHGSI